MVSDSLLGNRFPATSSEGAPAASLASGAEPAAPLDLRALFTGHYASVWRLLRRFGVAAGQLDDAAQEVFWVAARRLADIESGREKAFLYGVALRVASNEVRRQNAASLLAPPLDIERHTVLDFSPNPEESLEQRRALGLLDSVLGRMPLELRTVFVLFELEGMEVSKIAAVEGIPLGTASSRLRRARTEFSAIAKRIRAGMHAAGEGR